MRLRGGGRTPTRTPALKPDSSSPLPHPYINRPIYMYIHRLYALFLFYAASLEEFDLSNMGPRVCIFRKYLYNGFKYDGKRIK
jgi:hypothetical protein